MKIFPIILISLIFSGFIIVSLIGDSNARFQRIIKYLSSVSAVSAFSLIVVISISHASSRGIFFQTVIFSAYSVILASLMATYFTRFSSKIIISVMTSAASLFMLPIIEGTHSYALVNFPDQIAWGEMHRISLLLIFSCFFITLFSVGIGHFIFSKFKVKKISNTFEKLTNIKTFSGKFLLVIVIISSAIFMGDFRGYYSSGGIKSYDGTVFFWIFIIVVYAYFWILSKKDDIWITSDKEVYANWLIFIGLSVLSTGIFLFNFLHTRILYYFTEEGGWLFFIAIAFIYYISYLAYREKVSS